jgi:hypothetical protein
MDLFTVLASERLRLADELEQLTPSQWDQPQLCEGWSNHVVAAHLNLPWSVSQPAFVVGLLRALGNVDRAMDRFSRRTADGLDPKACVALLRATRRTGSRLPAWEWRSPSPMSSSTEARFKTMLQSSADGTGGTRLAT